MNKWIIMNRLSVAVAIAFAVGIAGVSGAAKADETRFGLGVNAGYSAIKAKSKSTEILGVAGAGGSTFKPSGNNFGLTARLTHELDSGVFFGAQGNVVLERGDDTIIGALNTKVESERSFDLMGRLGKRFGAVSPYVTGGVSWLQVKATTAVGALSDSKKNTHRGWKIGLGADYDVTDHVTLFGQLAHARYGKENYNFSAGNTSLAKASAEIDTNELKVGVIYNF